MNSGALLAGADPQALPCNGGERETISQGIRLALGQQKARTVTSWVPLPGGGGIQLPAPACFPKHRRTDGSVCSKEEDRLADHRGEKRPAPGDPCAAGRLPEGYLARAGAGIAGAVAACPEYRAARTVIGIL